LVKGARLAGSSRVPSRRTSVESIPSPHVDSGRYLPGERGWIKTKNRDYRRYELEREGAFNRRRERQFV
jgi:hypothetical protein